MPYLDKTGLEKVLEKIKNFVTGKTTPLSDGLAAEKIKREEDDAKLQKNIEDEANARAVEDRNLSQSISNTNTNVTKLRTDLTAETTNRTNEDTAIKTNVTKLSTDLTTLQDQVNTIGASIGGGTSFTASNVIVSDSTGKKLVASGITTTELNCLDNVTSNIQTQLNGKLSTSDKAASASTADTATTAGSCTGNAKTATTLAASRTIKTNLSSTSSASFDGSKNITPGVSGTLGVANGGTGKTSFTTGSVLIGNGDTNINMVKSLKGALFSSATDAIPQFGTLPVAYGGTGATDMINARNNLGIKAQAGNMKVDANSTEALTINVIDTSVYIVSAVISVSRIRYRSVNSSSSYADDNDNILLDKIHARCDISAGGLHISIKNTSTTLDAAVYFNIIYTIAPAAD